MGEDEFRLYDGIKFKCRSLLTPDQQRDLFDGFVRDPISARYRQKWLAENAGGKSHPINTTTPSDAFGSRNCLNMELLLLSENFLTPGRSFEGADGLSQKMRALQWFANRMMIAEIFLWDTKVFEGAQAMTLPDHVFEREGWPYPFMWWAYEGVRGEPKKYGFTSALLVLCTDGALVVHFGSEYGTGKPVAKPELLPYGQVVSDGGSFSWVMKLIAFLNSKYTSKDSTRLSRGERRELARAGMAEAAEQEVRVVKLRQPKHQPNNGEEGEGIDWKSRWWVRGHIRNQWCPSTKSYKVIFIPPHIKGPEDKPIAPRVYAVVR